MRHFFRLLLTGRDNHTYDITRVLLLFGFLCVLVLAGYDIVVSGHPFDALGFSSGLTGLLFGGSGGIALKAKTEPGEAP